MLITEIVGISGFSLVDTCEVAKIKSPVDESGNFNFCFTIRIKLFHYSSVFFELSVDSSYQVVRVFIVPVVEFCAALIGTKLFINPA